jgi:hypothetical protein
MQSPLTTEEAFLSQVKNDVSAMMSTWLLAEEEYLELEPVKAVAAKLSLNIALTFTKLRNKLRAKENVTEIQNALDRVSVAEEYQRDWEAGNHIYAQACFTWVRKPPGLHKHIPLLCAMLFQCRRHLENSGKDTRANVYLAMGMSSLQSTFKKSRSFNPQKYSERYQKPRLSKKMQSGGITRADLEERERSRERDKQRNQVALAAAEQRKCLAGSHRAFILGDQIFPPKFNHAVPATSQGPSQVPLAPPLVSQESSNLGASISTLLGHLRARVSPLSVDKLLERDLDGSVIASNTQAATSLEESAMALSTFHNNGNGVLSQIPWLDKISKKDTLHHVGPRRPPKLAK